MFRRFTAVMAVLVAGIVAWAGSASGASSDRVRPHATSSASSTSGIPLKPGENSADESLTGGKRGGSLTVLSSTQFEHMDPGQEFFQPDYGIMSVTQRPLLIYMPNSRSELAPDLATAVPSTSNGGVTNGGKTITVHIQPDVKYAPPVNRTVTSADVKYAIQRLPNKNVGNGYFNSYFRPFLVGAAKASGGNISGIVTPNKTTIVFHLTKPVANLFIQALTLPGTAPVPKEVVGPLDKFSPTKFGVTKITATGPYMFKGEQNGNSITAGFNPEKSLSLVRNPNWNPKTYAGPYKPPALLDTINVKTGGDPSVIGPQVLKGSSMVELDAPSRATVQEAYEQFPSQITFTPGSAINYASLDNSSGIFKNVWVRRAVYANLNRNAIIKQNGGALTGTPGTHFIYLGTAGFAQAGGNAGPNVPWNRHPNGDLKLAEHYMKKAGYPSGKYTGTKAILLVGSDNGSSEEGINQLVVKDMNELGIKTHLVQVDTSVMYSKYCEIAKADVASCPHVGWNRDFDDAYSILYPLFSSKVITATANYNYGQVRDPVLDKLMAKALVTVNPAADAELWAKADERIVDQAEAIPEYFNIQPNVFSKNVHWVGDLYKSGQVDLAYTGLK